MTSAKHTHQDNKLRNWASSFLNKDRELLEVGDYSIGDIQTEQDVRITEKGALAGDVLAPRVIVAGIVYGFVAAREIVIESSGQIWGDVHSVALEVSPGGKIHGWVSTLDEGTVDLLRGGDLDRGDLTLPGGRTLPDELIELLPGGAPDLIEEDAEPRLLIWRQLRAEAASALMARSEIEATFERRLSENARFSTLDKANQEKQSDTTELQTELDQLKTLTRRAVVSARATHSHYLSMKAALEDAEKTIEELEAEKRSSLSSQSQEGRIIPKGSQDPFSTSRLRDQQLAELRTALVEKEVLLKEMSEEIAKLTSQQKHMIRMATKRIRSLEAELAKKQ